MSFKLTQIVLGAIALLTLSCIVNIPVSNAQEQAQAEQQKLSIKWSDEAKKKSNELRFSVSLFFDSGDASANRNSITVHYASDDQKLDAEKIGAVMKVVNKAIFDDERPLGLSAAHGKDIYFNASCKLSTIDKNSQLLVIGLRQLSESATARVFAMKSGVYLIEKGKLASVVRVPGPFIFVD